MIPQWNTFKGCKKGERCPSLSATVLGEHAGVKPLEDQIFIFVLALRMNCIAIIHRCTRVLITRVFNPSRAGPNRMLG